MDFFEHGGRNGGTNISYINMIFIFLNYSIDFNRIRTDL